MYYIDMMILPICLNCDLFSLNCESPTIFANKFIDLLFWFIQVHHKGANNRVQTNSKLKILWENVCALIIALNFKNSVQWLSPLRCFQKKTLRWLYKNI